MKGKTPVEDIPLKLGKPKTTAAGIPAGLPGLPIWLCLEDP